MAETLCPQCNLSDDPVTVENGVSVPDINGNIVMLHSKCVSPWLVQSGRATTPILG
jgi:hypothetical protein